MARRRKQPVVSRFSEGEAKHPTPPPARPVTSDTPLNADFIPYYVCKELILTPAAYRCFFRKLVIDFADPDGCWLYGGRYVKTCVELWITGRGYVTFSPARVAWSGVNEPLGEHVRLRNICGRLHCVRPSHHVPSLSMSGKMVWGRARTMAEKFCAKGHRIAGENVYYRGAFRHCRVCT